MKMNASVQGMRGAVFKRESWVKMAVSGVTDRFHVGVFDIGRKFCVV